jgi:hypothetical protein
MICLAGLGDENNWGAAQFDREQPPFRRGLFLKFLYFVSWLLFFIFFLRNNPKRAEISPKIKINVQAQHK